MYNLLISLAITLGIFGLVAALMQPVAAIVPALFVFPLAMFLLARRTGKLVEAELSDLPTLLQARKVDEVKEIIRAARDRHGKWQFLLEGQLTGQLGMLDYMSLKFDEALPQLESGRWRDWTANTAIGCVHYRKGRYDKAWEAFEAAQKVGSKEAMVYVVHATLLTRRDDREGALKVLSEGLERIEGSKLLKTLKTNIANKKKLDTSDYPESWYQFFPEDAQQMMNMRGRRGSHPGGVAPGGRYQGPPPQPKQRGKMARRR